MQTCPPHLVKSQNAGRVLLLAATLLLCVGVTTRADEFPEAGYDSFESTAIFNVVLTPAFGGDTYTIRVEDNNTVILRSSKHSADENPNWGAIVGDGTAPPPVIVDPDNVSDDQMGPKPSTFEQGTGIGREVHTKMAWLNLQNNDGWRIRAGDAAPTAPRSLGEVESLNPWGEPETDFPARSFFNLYLEVDLPPSLGGMTLVNVVPITVEIAVINEFPPIGEVYQHTFETVNGNATALYDITGCNLVGWL